MILIEVGSVAMTLRLRGALGTEGGKSEGNNDYVESSHMQNNYYTYMNVSHCFNTATCIIRDHYLMHQYTYLCCTH